MRKKYKAILRWTVAGLLVAIAVMLYWGSRGVDVRVINNSDQTLRKVALHYTGGALSIDALEAGAERTVTLKATVDSHLEVELHPSTGVRQRWSIDTYFGQGVHGSITVTISKALAVHTTHAMST